MFIAFLYMFRETTCPSSGENTAPMRHLILVTLKQVDILKLQLLFYDTDPCNFKIPTCFRVTNTRCRIGMVFSPDDGHIVARNM